MNNYAADTDQLLDEVGAIELELGLPKGFIGSLVKEDDWSFVIKSNALIEAVLSSWLTAHLDQPELHEPLSHLDLGNPKFGKVALTSALGLTTTFDRHFLGTLLSLRNQLAHRIENASFTFATYVGGLDPNQKKNFVKALSYFYLRESESGEPQYPSADLVLGAAKESMYLGLLLFLATVTLKIQTTKHERLSEKLRVRILELEAEQKRLESNRAGF